MPQPNLPPAVIVHGLTMAQAVLAVGRPVTLLSGVGAGCYAGVGWWQALVRAARLAAPDACVADMLDCGQAPGRVLEALRAGQRQLVLRTTPAIFTDLAKRAARQGAVVRAAPPPALDMAHHGALRGLAAWLADG